MGNLYGTTNGDINTTFGSVFEIHAVVIVVIHVLRIGWVGNRRPRRPVGVK